MHAALGLRLGTDRQAPDGCGCDRDRVFPIGELGPGRRLRSRLDQHEACVCVRFVSSLSAIGRSRVLAVSRRCRPRSRRPLRSPMRPDPASSRRRTASRCRWRSRFAPAERIGMIIFEQPGGSRMTPRDLVGIARCRGNLFQACACSGHVSSNFAKAVADSWANKGFLVQQTGAVQVRKLLRRKGQLSGCRARPYTDTPIWGVKDGMVGPLLDFANEWR